MYVEFGRVPRHTFSLSPVRVLDGLFTFFIQMPAPAKRGASWLNGRRAAISRSRRNLAAFSSAAISGDRRGSSRSSAETPTAAAPSETRRPFFALRP